MSKETKALNRISTALGGASKVQKNDILNEIAGNVDGLAGVEIYICGNGEYDTETGLPTVTDKDEKTIYLTPTGEDVPNMYNEYIWKGDAWELFGSSAGGVKNITDGSAAGSIRGIAAVEEDNIYTLGANAVAVGSGTKAEGINSHAEGSGAKAIGGNSHAEGSGTAASGSYSHAEGDRTNAIGSSSHTEGYNSRAEGDYAHAEGYGTSANGERSHAEGSGASTSSTGTCAHAEGTGTTASNTNAHAEGNSTTASGKNSHAEGKSTRASGQDSHAEGESTKAEGARSHAEGTSTEAKGDYSHAEGWHSQAKHRSQHVFGEYNIVDPSSANNMNRGTYVEIVGNGLNSSDCSNARTLSWTGDEWLAGKLTVGAAPTNDMDVATKKYVDDLINGLDATEVGY